MSMILELMAVFSKVALGAFGGGLAMIPFIHYELVMARPWLSETMFNEVVSLAQMTPGPIALNAATFVGYRMAGFWGAFFATLALAGTPIIIIALLLRLISATSPKTRGRIGKVQKALRPAVAGMLMSAFWTLAKPVLPNPVLLALVGACIPLSFWGPFRTYPQLLLLVSALAGLCLAGYIVV